MMRIPNQVTWILAAVLVAAFASHVRPVPYASGVRNTGGNMYEFVLNESADSVTMIETVETQSC